MPIINVQMLNGRTPDQKRLLIRELGAAATRVLGVPEEAVRIVLAEIAPEHWGIGCSSFAELRAGVQSGADLPAKPD